MSEAHILSEMVEQLLSRTRFEFERILGRAESDYLALDDVMLRKVFVTMECSVHGLTNEETQDDVRGRSRTI